MNKKRVQNQIYNCFKVAKRHHSMAWRYYLKHNDYHNPFSLRRRKTICKGRMARMWKWNYTQHDEVY